MSNTGHGTVGHREQQFTEILPAEHPAYDVHKLAALAALLKGPPDTVKDGPDPEENLWVPAGYTYFGQFVDHDLTFDSTSSLNHDDRASLVKTLMPTNLRTPRFDLDCVYGDGPDAQPFMYAADGATLLTGGAGGSLLGVPMADGELLRAPNGRAIIGDKRNDENSIVNQIQQGFIRFHNVVVALLLLEDSQHWVVPNQLFESARREVTWTYQRLVLEDFLPRIVKKEVFADLVGTVAARDARYVMYTTGKRGNLPREFVVAAYRFGHSGVRTGYRLNATTRLSIFPGSEDDQDDDSLLGFDPLPAAHVIDDWGRFFPDEPPGVFTTENRDEAADDQPIRTRVRLQLAYKIDTNLVDPLGVLPIPVAGAATRDQAVETIKPDVLPDAPRPSLALLNLLRGNAYKVPGGQAYVDLLRTKFPTISPLAAKHLVVRTATGTDGEFRFTPFDAVFQHDTPLWAYILAEAQVPVVDFITPKLKPDGTFPDTLMLKGDGAKTQLGWVGGRIVAEVFFGLIDADEDSVARSAPAGWKPRLAAINLKSLLTFKPPAPAL